MSSKADVLAKVVNNSNYLGSYVKELINGIHCEESPNEPDYYKKGDVIKVHIQHDGTKKPRPSVVIKVTKEYLVSIPLTTTEDVNALCPQTGSRFFKEGWFCKNYIVTPVDRAVFLGCYDSMKSLNGAIKSLKEFINKNI